MGVSEPGGPRGPFENANEQQKVLHPTSFFVIGIPLSMQDEPTEIPPDAVELSSQGFSINPEKLRSAKVGIKAMLVTEVGPLPEDHPREVHAPYDKDCTVYYAENTDIKVHGYAMVHIERVLAWADPE